MGGASGEEGGCSNKETEDRFPEDFVNESSNQEDNENSDKAAKKARYVWQIKGNYHLKCPENDKELVMDHIRTDFKNGIDPQQSSSHSSDTSDESSDPEGSDCFPMQTPSQKRSSPVWYRLRPDWPVLKWQTRQVAKAFVDNTINCVLEDMGFVPLPADSDDILDEEFSSAHREQNDNSLEDKAVLMAIQSHGLHRSEQAQDSSFQSNPTNIQNIKRRYFFPHLDSDVHCENSNLKKSYLGDQVSANECTLIDKSNTEISIPSPCGSNQNQSAIESCRSQSEIESFCNAKNKHASSLISQKMYNCPEALSKRVCICPMRHSKNPKQEDSNFQKTFSKGSSVNSDVSEGNSNDCSEDCSSGNESQIISSVQSEPHNSSSFLLTKRPAEDAIFCSDSKRRCMDHLSLSQRQVNLVSDSETTSESNLQSFEHFDFMDAAVVAAIQKKGLSALACTEYG